MSAPDELRDLWMGQPSGREAKGEDLVARVRQRTKRFDRMILTRNSIECAAALFVAVFFARVALLQRANGVQRAGGLIVAAGAAWIIVHVLRYGPGPSTVDPSQDLTGYASALLARYDHQIRLLKSAKYWYLLPMYLGLLIMSAGAFLDRSRLGTLGWWDLGGPAVYTAVFAAVWWLNEVNAVGRLEKERARLASLTAPAGHFSEEAE